MLSFGNFNNITYSISSIKYENINIEKFSKLELNTSELNPRT